MRRCNEWIGRRILFIVATSFLTACGCNRAQPSVEPINSTLTGTDEASTTAIPQQDAPDILSSTPAPQASAIPDPRTTSATSVPTDQTKDSWKYSESKNEIRGTVSKLATKESVNTVEFGFPYAGVQHGTIMVIDDESVLFYVEKGQIICRGGDKYGTCLVLVKFDDEKERYVKAEKLGDDSTTIRFAEPGFLKNLKDSQKVMIEVQVYRNGLPVFTFDVRGLSQE